MCLSAAWIGVIAYLRKQSLLGEALSHTSYPGVIVGALISAVFLSSTDNGVYMPVMGMVGAFVTAFSALYFIHFLERYFKMRADSAMCFVLSAYVGIGITIASRMQFTHSSVYAQSLNYLYGQAATMTDIHIVLYGVLSFIIIATTLIFYKELKVLTFDRDYAKSLGIPVGFIDAVVFVLLTLAIVVGIRSVGVVLMSAMLIAPAVAARQFTHRLLYMLLIAGIFGMVSGLLGNVLSVELSNYLKTLYPQERLGIPTGPMIVVVATFICLVSLLFAPERGLIVRLIRIALFRYQCLRENIMKTMWRISKDQLIKIEDISRYQTVASYYICFILYRLSRHGWVEKKDGGYRLTIDGRHRAAHIVRLHRLWEVYLADYLGVGSERVHMSAEEMEHILTPELEAELTALLKDPQVDPHDQPIPPPIVLEEI
jgi:manganese/zinc/iron transport system permease protein